MGEETGRGTAEEQEVDGLRHRPQVNQRRDEPVPGSSHHSGTQPADETDPAGAAGTDSAATAGTDPAARGEQRSAARAQDEAAGPGGEAARPGDEAGAPGGEAARPGGEAGAPGGEAAGPGDEAAGPDDEAAGPGKAVRDMMGGPPPQGDVPDAPAAQIAATDEEREGTSVAFVANAVPGKPDGEVDTRGGYTGS